MKRARTRMGRWGSRSGTAVVAALLLGTAFASPQPKVVRATVAEPVLEELMGGCSMRCTFAWTVEVREPGKEATTKLLNDEKATTAWISQEGNGGVGTVFRLAFPKRIPKVMEGEVPFYGLDLINGNWDTEETWREYSRVKKARILYNQQVLGEVTFADSRRWQRLKFPDIMVRSADALTLEVLEVYPGPRQRLALSELVLQGAH